MLVDGFLNFGMLIFMAAALVVALRRADRADREDPDRHPFADAVNWLVHPRAHHRH